MRARTVFSGLLLLLLLVCLFQGDETTTQGDPRRPKTTQDELLSKVRFTFHLPASAGGAVGRQLGRRRGGDWWEWGGREGGPRVRGLVCGADGEVGRGKKCIFGGRARDGIAMVVEGVCVW